jgi:hypothetical protein
VQSAGGGCEHCVGQLGEPAPDEKPGGQGVHAVDLGPEDVRTSQSLQVELFVAPLAVEYVPAEQLTMPAPSALAEPAPPTPGQNAPGAQVNGTSTSAAAMYQPAISVQPDRAVAPLVELEPLGQGAEPLVTTCVAWPTGLWVPTAVAPRQ